MTDSEIKRNKYYLSPSSGASLRLGTSQTDYYTKELRSQVSLFSIELGLLILRGLVARAGELGAGVLSSSGGAGEASGSGKVAVGSGGESGGRAFCV